MPTKSLLCKLIVTTFLGVATFSNAQALSDADYMRIASYVARNVQRPSLANYYGWSITPENWHDSLNDSLFGPFLNAQEEKPGRALGCVILEFTNNDAICVYFDGDKPYGYVAIKNDVGDRFTVDAIKNAFKPITPDLLEPPGQHKTQHALPQLAQDSAAKHLTKEEYVRLASDVAYNMQRDSIDYYNGFIIDSSAWHNALSDKLFGAFLGAQDEKKGQALVCIMSELSNDATCVYFQDHKPFGVAALKVEVGHQYTVDEVKAAYKPITPELLQKHADKDKNKITDGQSVLDNGTLIPAEIITEGAH